MADEGFQDNLLDEQSQVSVSLLPLYIYIVIALVLTIVNVTYSTFVSKDQSIQPSRTGIVSSIIYPIICGIIIFALCYYSSTIAWVVTAILILCIITQFGLIISGSQYSSYFDAGKATGLDKGSSTNSEDAQQAESNQKTQ
jgi:hypothetical protein